MASSFFSISKYSRFNLSESESDIEVFVKEYGYRIKRHLANELDGCRSQFPSFVERKIKAEELPWIEDNFDRFFKESPNKCLETINYLSEYGFITSMIYSPDGDFLIVGHSTGVIQNLGSHDFIKMTNQREILRDYLTNIQNYYKNEKNPKLWYPMFYRRVVKRHNFLWVKENHERFLSNTPNEVLYNRWYGTEMGAVTSLTFSRNGSHLIVGHASGAIQMRHGTTGVVLCTLRNIQFPPKPIYALEYSRFEDRVCYAACTDGAVYRIDIPNIVVSTNDPPQYCIRADPALEYLNTQFYGAPGISSAAVPFITHRSAALSLGLSADEAKFIVGYADSSIKVYDIETQEVEATFKVHKLRLQFIPKKLQRMHSGQVCALRCHDDRPRVFASGAWDNTLRVWDTRCPVGCVATFEGVDICSDSIDINRDHCIAGSWQATEALTVWDIVARKRLNIIRVQNRRPDVDGEFLYACRYWRSPEFNRKGKYAIIGGSGTNCVEVINLHNRYITCSYPAAGSVLAITSYEERIAFGGTAPVLNIVSFHDPKHEKYHEVEPEYEYTKGEKYFSDSSSEILPVVSKLGKVSTIGHPAMAIKSSISQRIK